MEMEIHNQINLDMSKKSQYSPVRIKDPLSDHYLVKILPTQGFDIHLTPSMGSVVVEPNSNFLYLAEKTIVEDNSIYRFKQKFDLSEWAEISKAYLGSISINAEKVQSLINLCIMLESKKVQDIVTVINPKRDEIRLEPGEILEVVLFDKALSPNMVWESQFVPSGNGNGLRYELSDEKVVKPLVSKHNNILRRCPDENQLETHFWFKHDFSSGVAVSTIDDGIYDVGMLVFDAGPDNTFRQELIIKLVVKNKKTNNSSVIKTNSTGKIINPPNTSIVQSNTKILKTEEYDYNSYTGYNANNVNWDKNRRKHVHVSDPYDSTKKKKVKLKEKKTESFEDGCNVMFYEDGNIIGGTYSTEPEDDKASESEDGYYGM